MNEQASNLASRAWIHNCGVQQQKANWPLLSASDSDECVSLSATCLLFVFLFVRGSARAAGQSPSAGDSATGHSTDQGQSKSLSKSDCKPLAGECARWEEGNTGGPDGCLYLWGMTLVF